jgi:hypothetical protein
VLQSGDVQDAAFGVHLVEFHPAGFRDAQAMPEHQEQQATVAGFVPAPPGRLNQLFNLAPGKVLSVAVIPPCVFAFASVHHFVESFPCAMPRKPA